MLRGGAVRGGSLAAGRHPWPHGGVVRTVHAICAPGGGQRCMVPAAALRAEAGHRPPAVGRRDCGDLLVAFDEIGVDPKELFTRDTQCEFFRRSTGRTKTQKCLTERYASGGELQDVYGHDPGAKFLLAPVPPSAIAAAEGSSNTMNLAAPKFLVGSPSRPPFATTRRPRVKQQWESAGGGAGRSEWATLNLVANAEAALVPSFLLAVACVAQSLFYIS